MAQLLEGPAAAEQILRHRGFAQVELADPATVLETPASAPTEAARSGAATSDEEETEPAEPTLSPPSAGIDSGNAGGSGAEDPWGPDIGIDAEDWLDTDHDAHVDEPPAEELEWMHPEEQRLYPVPDHPQWGCLDERGSER